MTVVLIHAFPFDHRLWQHVAGLLGRNDVLVPDLLGCGGREVPADPPSLEVLAQDVWRQVGNDSAPVVIGISLGGYVAFEMLRQRPLAGLGLIDTKCTADSPEGRTDRERLATTMEHGGRMALYAEQALPTLLGRDTHASRPEVVATVRQWIEQANPHAVAWLARAMANRPDSTADLAAFTSPVLLPLQRTTSECSAVRPLRGTQKSQVVAICHPWRIPKPLPRYCGSGWRTTGKRGRRYPSNQSRRRQHCPCHRSHPSQTGCPSP